MSYNYILFKKEGHIGNLIFNRPERLNALHFEMVAEIGTALKAAEDDEDIRVLVLSGAGRAFCSGGDFKDGSHSPASLAAQERQDPIWLAETVFNLVMNIVGRLQKLRMPTIAMVNGVAAGAGFSMAQACDMRIGSDRTKLIVAWTRRGVIPAFGDTWMLPRIVGVAKAAELIFTGRTVEAEEALSMGLLNKLVPHERLEEETRAFASLIANGPPLAMRLSKYNIYGGLNMDLENALRLLTMCQGALHLTEDYKESAKAFLEKRDPVFKGK